MKNFIILLVIVVTGFTACNDEFLEKYPIERASEATAFKTYDNFQTYAWGLYSYFTEIHLTTNAIDLYTHRWYGDAWAGHAWFLNTRTSNPYNARTVKVPGSSNETAGGDLTYGLSGWNNFTYVRRVNIMLDNIEKSSMNAQEKAHWKSVGYFFHSLFYMELVSRYGDVPWVNQHISVDSDVAYSARTPRAQVVDSIMTRLLYAETNIKELGEGVGSNTINKACVQVLISRLGLFEGTWRKYHAGKLHGINDATATFKTQNLLEHSIRASEALISKYPSLINFDALMNTDNLNNSPGVIFYKQYESGLIMNAISRYARTNQVRYELPKHTVELYLTKNGLPIHNAANQSPNPNSLDVSENEGKYCGDVSMYHEFRNRDRRLILTVMPPYYSTSGTTASAFDYLPPTELGIDINEYVNLLPTLPELALTTTKRYPASNFLKSVVLTTIPNIEGPGQGPFRSQSGYLNFRHYNDWDSNDGIPTGTVDKPIFHIGEIWLNYAEAKFEMNGTLTQAEADVSINKLRVRVGTANMNVAQSSAPDFDPMRDPTVEPLLWEIRRERIVELLGEGFGFSDIRRWRKGEWYINRNVKGVYVRYKDYIAKPSRAVVPAWKNIHLVDKNYNDVPGTDEGEGYIKLYPDQSSKGKGWDDAFYLFPIPLEELTLNENLKQNPGWEKY